MNSFSFPKSSVPATGFLFTRLHVWLGALLALLAGSPATAAQNSPAGDAEPASQAPLVTASDRFEAAQNYIRVADSASRAGQPAASAAAARQALSHLSEAEHLAPTASLKANARALSGFICERFLGDLAAAKIHYEAALQFSPADWRSQARLNRIEQQTRSANRE